MQEISKVYSWSEIIDNLKSPFNTYVFVSMRNSGKSKSIRNLVKELLHKVKHQNIVLFSTTAYNQLNDDYKFIKDSKHAAIFPGGKSDIDDNIDKLLKYSIDMKKKQKPNNPYSMLVIFDDIDITKRNDKVAELFTQGRHYNMSVIVSSQNAAYFLSPTIRTNIDFLVFRKVENTYKKTLYNICNTDMTFPEFKTFVDINTEDYKFILYDNTSQKSDDDERLKIVKAVLFKDMEIVYKKKQD